MNYNDMLNFRAILMSARNFFFPRPASSSSDIVPRASSSSSDPADSADSADLTSLIRALDSDLPLVSPAFHHRVMVQVAHRAIALSRRRARQGLIASLSGLSMLLVGSIAALVIWFPVLLPAFVNFSWLDKLRSSFLKFPFRQLSPPDSSLPFLEQWGGLLLIVLLVVVAVGFVFYLNSLFSSDSSSD